jgi:hypothetical protein
MGIPSYSVHTACRKHTDLASILLMGDESHAESQEHTPEKASFFFVVT